MPFAFKCLDHPDVQGTVLEDVAGHLGHRIESSFVRQVQAQGHAEIFIGGCRTCGHIGTISPDTGLCAGCVARV